MFIPSNNEKLRHRSLMDRLWIYGACLFIASCGLSPPSRVSEYSRLRGFGVNDLSSDPRAAAAVAAQTETENGRAPGACLEILLNESHDEFFDVKAERESEKTYAWMCAISEDQIISMLKESHSRKTKRSTGFDFLIDSLTEFGKKKLDLNFNQSDTLLYDDYLARADAQQIRRLLCNNEHNETFATRAVESFKRVASSVTLEKYNACVRSRSYGLRCDVSPTKDYVSATIRWEPTELVRSFLPRVALDWSSLVNLSSTQPLPKFLGIGSGLSVALVRNNKTTDSVFGVTAFDASGYFSFSCNAALSKSGSGERKIVLRRDASCGVELYKEQADQLCGVERYNEHRSEACGVELHKDIRSPACGIDSYNSRHDCAVCGQVGIVGGCRQCEHPMFGIASYKSCRHVDHGVEIFASCQHPQHGVAHYKLCRKPEFGVELYKECLVEDTANVSL